MRPIKNWRINGETPVTVKVRQLKTRWGKAYAWKALRGIVRFALFRVMYIRGSPRCGLVAAAAGGSLRKSATMAMVHWSGRNLRELWKCKRAGALLTDCADRNRVIVDRRSERNRAIKTEERTRKGKKGQNTDAGRWKWNVSWWPTGSLGVVDNFNVKQPEPRT